MCGHDRKFAVNMYAWFSHWQIVSKHDITIKYYYYIDIAVIRQNGFSGRTRCCDWDYDCNNRICRIIFVSTLVSIQYLIPYYIMRSHYFSFKNDICCQCGQLNEACMFIFSTNVFVFNHIRLNYIIIILLVMFISADNK